MKEADIIIFDVAFGDAIYIKIKEDNNVKHSILIDSGYAKHAKKYLSYLSKEGLGIDYLVITHKHTDHFAGVKTILEDPNFSIQGIITRIDDKNNWSESYKKLNDFLVKEKFPVYDIFSEKAGEILEDFEILYPFSGVRKPVSDNQNQNSIVLALHLQDGYFMLMGDATVKEESLLLAKKQIIFENVYGVKIGHHGSETSTGTEFIRALQTADNLEKYGFVSCNNSNNPPPHEKIKREWLPHVLEYTEIETTKNSIRVHFCGDALTGVEPFVIQ